MESAQWGRESQKSKIGSGRAPTQQHREKEREKARTDSRRRSRDDVDSFIPSIYDCYCTVPPPPSLFFFSLIISSLSLSPSPFLSFRQGGSK